MVSALGGPARAVVREPWIGGHAWSPIDDNEIVYTLRGSPSGLYRVSISSGETRLLAEAFDPHSPSWSPDGRQIAYVSGNGDSAFGTAGFANIASSSVWVISADGEETTQITDTNSLNTSPVWAEDSSSLYFISRRHGSHDIYQIALPGNEQEFSEPHRVTTGLNAHSVTFDATRRSLVYSVLRSAANIWSLAIPGPGQLDTPAPKRITSGNQLIEVFDISSDGEWLVYDSNSRGNQDIYKKRLGGGPEMPLTDDPADDFSPSLSPNRDAIAFHSFRNGNRDVLEVPFDGGTVRQLTSDPSHEWQPDHSPDGNNLVCVLFEQDGSGRAIHQFPSR